ncbi:MAG: hypothetical protein IJR63_01520 [Synergistaceae bacterium]|nr:hypothetical protein [Synergistaceae bacterium]
MLSNDIQNHERLYRAVKRSKSYWLDSQNRPTSAMFKDVNGVSVDRDGGREEPEIVRFMCEVSLPKRVKGIASLSVSECLETGADVAPAPSKVNPYHANIFLDSSDFRRYNVQALRLARASKLIFFDEAKEWTQ